MMSSIEIRPFVVVGIALLACGYDLRTRRIPNVLTFGAAAVAAVFHGFLDGLSGAAMSSAGWLLGVAMLFPFFALRGLGAGDVKLLGALGAWVGPTDTVYMALYTAIAGGVMALAVGLAQGYTRKAFSNLWWLLGYWRLVGLRPLPELTLEEGRGPRLAYAVPIAAGALTTLWLR